MSKLPCIIEDQDIVVGLKPLLLVEHILRADGAVGKVRGEEVEADPEQLELGEWRPLEGVEAAEERWVAQLVGDLELVCR